MAFADSPHRLLYGLQEIDLGDDITLALLPLSAAGRGRRPAGRTASPHTSRQACPQTLEAVPNASFEFQTVSLCLKIIFNPKEFFYSERPRGSIRFLLFLHWSQVEKNRLE